MELNPWFATIIKFILVISVLLFVGIVVLMVYFFIKKNSKNARRNTPYDSIFEGKFLLKKTIHIIALILGVLLLPIAYILFGISGMTFDAPGSMSEPKAWIFFIGFNLVALGLPALLILFGLKWPRETEVLADDVDKPYNHGLVRAYFRERLIAFLADYILINILITIPSLVVFSLLDLDKSQTYLITVILFSMIEFLLYIGYFGVFAYIMGGQTLGKKWVKIKVVNLEGENLTLKQFLFREFIARGIPVLGKMFLANFAYAFYLTYILALNENRQALHDNITKTQVIIVK